MHIHTGTKQIFTKFSVLTIVFLVVIYGEITADPLSKTLSANAFLHSLL